MPAPTNISALTATDLGSVAVPVSVTQDVNFGGTTYTVWYRFTAAVGATVLGIWACGDLAVYTASLTVYGPDSSTVNLLSTSGPILNVPVQIPVTAGSVYYLKIASYTGNVGAASLTLTTEPAPTRTAPAGSFFINDDTAGFPAVLLSATDGTVLRVVSPFPAGEGGDILRDGTMLVEDVLTQNLKLYDQHSALQATIEFPWTTGHPTIRSNKVDTFYVGAPGNDGDNFAVVKRFSSTGVEEDSWTLPNLLVVGIAPSNDETKLYVTGQASSLNPQIKVWDLVNDVMLTDLTAGPAGQRAVEDLLVLDDDSIIAAFNTTGLTLVLNRYSAAGAVLNTVDYGAGEVLNNARLAYDLDDPLVFWLWSHLTTHGSRFRKIRASDFTVLLTFDAPTFERGVWEAAATATPTRFGSSHSCPFFLTRQAAISTVTDPIRMVRRFSLANDKRLWLTIHRLEVELQRGVGLSTGQGSDPQVMVSLSKDGAMTWGPARWMGVGKIGEYLTGVYSNRFGRSKDWACELVFTDPVLAAWAAVWIDVEESSF